MTRPEIRANWSRMLLEYYERTFTPEMRTAVLEPLRRDVIARILGAGPLEWLPAELHLALLEAPHDRMGAAAFREMWRAMTFESLDRPIFRSLVQGALAVFKTSPGHFYRILPQGWSLVARGTGDFIVTPARNEPRVEIVWTRIPRVLCARDTFATAWAGSLVALLDATKTKGRVDVDATALSRGTVQFEVAW